MNLNDGTATLPGEPALPKGVIPLMPMRNVVLFPHVLMPIAVGRAKSIAVRGLVLPVGGIKEKVLAAQRAGVITVLLPARNEKDLRDVPESTCAALRFVWLQTIDDAVGAALGDTTAPAPRERFELF